MRSLPTGYGGECGYMLRSGAAASAYNVDEPFVDQLSHHAGHAFGCLDIIARLVGKPGVGVARHRIKAYARQFGHPGLDLPRAERAVEPYGIYACMAHRSDERLKGLAGECPAVLSGYRHRHHHGDLSPAPPHDVRCGLQSGLEVECVKHCLEQQQVHPAIHQPFYLGGISVIKLIVGHAPHTRITYVGAH